MIKSHCQQIEVEGGMKKGICLQGWYGEGGPASSSQASSRCLLIKLAWKTVFYMIGSQKIVLGSNVAFHYIWEVSNILY